MITLLRLYDTREHTVWMVEHNGQLKRVTTPRRTVRYSLTGMRHAICKATRLDATQFRHIENVRVKDRWVSKWMTV